MRSPSIASARSREPKRSCAPRPRNARAPARRDFPRDLRAAPAAGMRHRRRRSSRASTRASSTAAPCSASVLSAATAKRLPEAAEDQATAVEPVDHTSPGRAKASGRRGDSRASSVPATRRAATKSHQGNRPALGRTAQRSPLSRSRKDSRASSGPISVSAAPLAAEIVHGRVVAGDQQVIAVVDAAAERRVQVGAAAPARLPRRLVQHDGDAGSARRRRAARPARPAPTT